MRHKTLCFLRAETSEMIPLMFHKYAAAQNLSEEEALKKAMEEKSKEFKESGAEVYTTA